MSNQQHYGLTAEDLEKAASVRLFEKAAAAEGINLNELSESQVEELYYNYQQSSEDNTMNEEIIDLFEKQAAYEGVDLESLNDEELAYVYNNFITNLAEEAEAEAEGAEAYPSEEVNHYLTEKTAHVFNMLKEAADAGDAGSSPTPDPDPKKAAPKADDGEGMFAKAKKKGGEALDYVKDKGRQAGDLIMDNKKTTGALALTAAAAGGYGLHKRKKAKQEAEKQAAADIMVDAFDSFIQDHHGVTSDDLDEDTFNNAYNEFLDMVANDIVVEQQEDQDAYEKLAEAEILGRHMARSYMDELEKEASAMDKAKRTGELLSAKHVRKNVAELAGPDAKAMDKIKAYGKILAGKADNETMTSEARKSLASQLAAAGGTTAAGVGGKKMYDKKKEQSKEASILEAQEYLIDQGINPFTGDWLTDYEIYELEKEAGKISDTAGKVQKHYGDKIKKVKSKIQARRLKDGSIDIVEVDKPKNIFGFGGGKKKVTSTKKDRYRLSDLGTAAGEFKKELAGVGVVGTGAGVAHSKRKKSQEKKASAQIEELAIERANEFIEFGKEAGFDGSLIDGFAVELLEDNGYDVSPLFE